MSGPLSLREARTKRQKAKVYKTSRSEFRSTLNSARNNDASEQEGTDQGDETMTRRKIMKVNEKGIGEQTEGEGSIEIGGNEEVPTTAMEEKDSDNGTAEDGGDPTADDEKKDEDEASESNDKKDKKDEKKDDDSDDNGGYDDFNMRDGEGDSNEESDEDDIDSSSEEEGGEGGNDDKNSDKGVDENSVQETNENLNDDLGEGNEIENQEPGETKSPTFSFCHSHFSDEESEKTPSTCDQDWEIVYRANGEYETDFSNNEDDMEDDVNEIRNAG